jgi:hypothetical protein
LASLNFDYDYLIAQGRKDEPEAASDVDDTFARVVNTADSDSFFNRRYVGPESLVNATAMVADNGPHGKERLTRARVTKPLVRTSPKLSVAAGGGGGGGGGSTSGDDSAGGECAGLTDAYCVETYIKRESFEGGAIFKQNTMQWMPFHKTLRRDELHNVVCPTAIQGNKVAQPGVRIQPPNASSAGKTSRKRSVDGEANSTAATYIVELRRLFDGAAGAHEQLTVLAHAVAAAPSDEVGKGNVHIGPLKKIPRLLVKSFTKYGGVRCSPESARCLKTTDDMSKMSWDRHACTA